jgi:formiminotetrahydrofolate cyclodeaminase
MPVGEFLEELASDSPAPGGGSAAALAGAVGAALCGMAFRLTVGREKFRGVWAEMEEALNEADGLRARLLDLVDEDTDAFRSFLAARKLPKITETERALREKAVREAALRCAAVPLETLRLMRRVAALAAIAVERGNPSCVTDAGVAAQMAMAAAEAAAGNVRVNLPAIADPGLRESLSRGTADGLSWVRETVDRTARMLDA